MSEYIATIKSKGRDDVVVSLEFCSDHAAIHYAQKCEDFWPFRCDVWICRPNGELVCAPDSLRHWRGKRA